MPTSPGGNVVQVGPPAGVTHKLSGPYLAASAAYSAGLRGWPLVVMTAVSIRESGAQNDPPKVDSNGIYSTGLWQINRANPAGLTNPLTNAQAMVQLLGGNAMGGLSNWALTPPGQTSASGIPQPNPYPWGTVPPATYSGYTDQSGVWHNQNYNLTASQIAQALYAYGQIQAFGPATSSELQSANGWGTAGGSAGTNQVSQTGVASDTSTTEGCTSRPPVFNFDLKVTSVGLSACQAKAIKGGFLVAVGGATMLFGLALVLVSGLAGKGPLGPVADVAAGYVAGARKLPGVGRSAPSTPSGPSEATVTSRDRRVIERESRKREMKTPNMGVNYAGGRPRRAPASEKVDDTTPF